MGIFWMYHIHIFFSIQRTDRINYNNVLISTKINDRIYRLIKNISYNGCNENQNSEYKRNVSETLINGRMVEYNIPVCTSQTHSHRSSCDSQCFFQLSNKINSWCQTNDTRTLI